jgi:hypothetical protein
MKGIFVHDETGKVRSFGILAETRKVRGGMHAPDGAVIAVVDIPADEVSRLRALRGHVAPNLKIAGSLKDARLNFISGR